MSYVIPVESSMGCTAPGPLLTSALLAPQLVNHTPCPRPRTLWNWFLIKFEVLSTALYAIVQKTAQKCRRP